MRRHEHVVTLAPKLETARISTQRRLIKWTYTQAEGGPRNLGRTHSQRAAWLFKGLRVLAWEGEE